MFLKSFKLIACGLAVSWLFSCPAPAGCSGGEGCCGGSCCKSEMAADDCQAAAIQGEAITFDLPILAVSIPSDGIKFSHAGTMILPATAPQLYLLVDRKLHPHTGPPWA